MYAAAIWRPINTQSRNGKSMSMTHTEQPFQPRTAHVLLALGFFFAWYFLVVDGLWGYGQYIVLKKKMVPSSVFVLTLGIAILGFRRPKNDSRDTRILPILYGWICWMWVVVLFSTPDPFASPFRILFGFYVNYWYFFLAALAINTSFRVREDWFLTLFYVGALPVVCLGVAQGIKQDNFAIGTWISQEAAAFNLGFFGQRRANSAFAHADDFGFFCGIVLAVTVALWLHKRNVWWRLVLTGVMGLSALGLHFTLTRAAYLMSACAMLAAFLIHRAKGKNSPLVTWLPAIFGFFALAIYLAAPLIRVFSSSSNLLSSASLAERLYGNQYYFSELIGHGWYTLLTGLGWYVNGHHRASFAIDNQYIALVLSVGLVGAALWFALTIILWRHMLDKALLTNSPLMIGLAGVCSTWLAQSMFNVTSTFAYACMVGLVLDGHLASRQSTVKTVPKQGDFRHAAGLS